MAVVARKYKSRITYYAVNDWRGKQVAERIGANQREAALRDRTMKKEIKAGTYQPPMSVVARTTGGYIESWLKERTNAYAPDERRMVKLYLEPREWLMEKPLDEVVPSDTDRLVKELRGEKKPDGSRRLSDKTIANVLGLMKQVFAAGIRADLCIRQPITLPPRTLKRTSAKEKEIYTPAEVVVLTRHHSIPWPIRVLNALAFFTGMREGEVCGRRWRDLEDASVLPAIVVRDQYEGRPLKTERPRVVPIHPELSKILTKWGAWTVADPRHAGAGLHRLRSALGDTHPGIEAQRARQVVSKELRTNRRTQPVSTNEPIQLDGRPIFEMSEHSLASPRKAMNTRVRRERSRRQCSLQDRYQRCTRDYNGRRAVDSAPFAYWKARQEVPLRGAKLRIRKLDRFCSNCVSQPQARQGIHRVRPQDECRSAREGAGGPLENGDIELATLTESHSGGQPTDSRASDTNGAAPVI